MDITLLLNTWQEALKDRFRSGFLPIEDTIFQFQFEAQAEAPLFLTANQQAFALYPGTHQVPTLTLFVRDHATALRLLTGEEDGMAAFMAGSYRADGNIILSQLLLYVFQQPALLQTQEVID
jgi:putative sterol carrier protein